MMKTGAQILWECLERGGVKHVFGYPGGAILPAYDALRRSSIYHVPVGTSRDRLSSALEREYTSSMQHLTLPIIVESDEDGYFVTCPALQGCYSQGETYEEAVANIKDAIRLHVEDRLAAGEQIPQPVSVSLSTIEIAV